LSASKSFPGRLSSIFVYLWIVPTIYYLPVLSSTIRNRGTPCDAPRGVVLSAFVDGVFALPGSVANVDGPDVTLHPVGNKLTLVPTYSSTGLICLSSSNQLRLYCLLSFVDWLLTVWSRFPVRNSQPHCVRTSEARRGHELCIAGFQPCGWFVAIHITDVCIYLHYPPFTLVHSASFLIVNCFYCLGVCPLMPVVWSLFPMRNS